ncbi:MAG TPA: hypothetical protein VGI10_10140, partial [Polyangiaceae bacterium]
WAPRTECFIEDPRQTGPFEIAKMCLAVSSKDLGNAEARLNLDTLIEVDERMPGPLGDELTDARLTRRHEAIEEQWSTHE